MPIPRAEPARAGNVSAEAAHDKPSQKEKEKEKEVQ
jgi:hypothetical protein